MKLSRRHRFPGVFSNASRGMGILPMRHNPARHGQKTSATARRVTGKTNVWCRGTTETKFSIAHATACVLPGDRRGAALVVVLAFLVLLSGVVLAFFARAMSERMVSNSSVNQTKAEILAQGALDQIVGDLKQEIADGSTVSTTGTTTIYTPTSNANAAPQLAGSTGTGGLERLLKRSSSTNAFYPGGSTRAAALSSTNASQNGRSVTPARWNKPLLLPKSTNSATDYTPVPTSGTFTAPDWIYVARDGSNPTAWNANMIASGTNPTAVVGRYAYNIYDESGLLDVNVAGYPLTGSPPYSNNPASQNPPYTSTNSDRSAFNKGVLAFADLTQLPGIKAMTAAKQKTIINSLVGWRNYASAKPAGALTNGYDFTGGPLTNFTTAIRANTNGFLTTANTDLFNGASDRMFGSRQELIRFLLQSVGTSIDSINLQAALQYLGTFSRAVTAPSWKPATPSGSTIDYAGQAENAASANRNIANVRFASGATITHYNDDGTTTPYKVEAGDPLLSRRFSLAKLAWLGYDGPKAGISAAAIQACFGLQWNAAKWRWDYVGTTPANLPAHIKTLEQVAAESREPNFFELLKAGILSGSLGRDPGPGVDVYDPAVGLGVYASQYDTYKADKDLNVMQIGANIIDQFDADSYPTAIYLDAFNFTNRPIDELAINTVYGIENLPVLLALTPVTLADPVPASLDGSLPSNAVLKFWLQPALWNPHQVPAAALADCPTKFRGYAYGKAYGMWAKVSITVNAQLAPKTEYDDGTGNVVTPGQPGEFYFSNPADGTSPFFVKPRLMTLDLTSTSGNQLVDVASTPADNCYDPSKNWDLLPGDQVPVNQFVGFALLPYQNYATTTLNTQIVPDLVVPLYVSLQYLGTDGHYHPYSFMARISQSANIASKMFRPSDVSSKIYGRTSSIQGWGGMRVDPRTDRFGESAQWFLMSSTICSATKAPNTLNAQPNNNFIPIYGSGNGGTGGYAVPINTAFTYVPTFTAGNPQPSLWAMNDPAFMTSGGSQAYYADPDGVVRYGDNYRRNDKTGDGCQLYFGDASVTGPASTLATPKSTSSPPGSAQVRRPVILNRAFRSVGELGYAYRDLPFKSLDLWSPTSADGALLDLFAVNDMPVVTAGQINMNNAPAAVLQAVIAGAAKSEVLADAPNGVQISSADASLLAGKIAADILANGPYRSRADLATRLGPVVSDPNYSLGRAFDTTLNTAAQPYSNWANKSYAEAPMRALADVTCTRTWNLMIDVIAQTGMFPPNATSLSAFTVQGERRYWLHLAIDRFTGKIVDKQLEPVYE